MAAPRPIALDLEGPFLDRVFRIAPLVVVGTREEDGTHDLAPKHMTMPVGDRHVAFVCTPEHGTLRNTERTREFTMSWVPADGVLLASLAAAPREGGAKPALAAVPTRPASVVDGVVLSEATVAVECRLARVVDGFNRWRVLIGEIVHATASSDALLVTEEDPLDTLRRTPVLGYLHPDHVVTVAEADRFPYHQGFSR